MTNIIDIHSKGIYPSNILSNFYHHSFEFDKVKIRSMESFLQSLKIQDKGAQIACCGLPSLAARNYANQQPSWKNTNTLYWLERAYNRNSVEYQLLLAKSYFAMMKASSKFRKALVDTENAELVHSIGKKNINETILTEEEFITLIKKCRIYTLKNKM